VEPVEVEASRGEHLEPGVGVVDGLGEVHLHTAQGIDHVGEGVEVEHHVVLDGNAQVLVDGRHQLARSLVEGGVDLVGPVGPGIGDEEVAGDRQDRHRALVRVEVQDHHHVTVHAVDTLRAEPVGGVLHLEGAPVGGPDHQDVLRTGVGAGGGHVGEAVDVEAVDLVVQVPAVARGAPHGDQQQHGYRTQDPLGLSVPARSVSP
jgi:hypothetical protein